MSSEIHLVWPDCMSKRNDSEREIKEAKMKSRQRDNFVMLSKKIQINEVSCRGFRSESYQLGEAREFLGRRGEEEGRD